MNDKPSLDIDNQLNFDTVKLITKKKKNTMLNI